MSSASSPLLALPEKSYLSGDNGLKSWLLTLDHKRIALLYLFTTVFFFAIGGTAAAIIRLELLTPAGDLVSSDTYNKLFSIHGIIMVFFFLVPIAPAVLGNFLIPLMIGARDVALPKINLFSWYLFAIGGCVELYMMIVGGVDTGWTFTTPLSTHYLNTNVIAAAMGIFIAGFSSILTGVNFIVTIHKMRAPGMTWFRLPLFIWSYYATSIIFVLANAGDCHFDGAHCARACGRNWRFRSNEGWRPSSIPTSLLVLFSSCRICHDLAGNGGHLGNDLLLLQKEGIWLLCGGVLIGRDCCLCVFCLGAPHVHHGHFNVFRDGLFVLHDVGCGSVSYQSV